MNPFLITAASFLIPLFPSISKWLTQEHHEKILPKVLEIASQITRTQSPSQMARCFSGNPEFSTQFEKKLIELEKDFLLAESLERQSARNRDVALLQTGHKNIRADIMVIAAALGLSACLLILTFYRENLPGEAVGIISTVAGIFGSCLKDAYAFEFGSSRGSKNKDQHVNAILHQWK